MSDTNSSNDKSISQIMSEQKNPENQEITLLYTEKYAPKHYSDLLTEEKVNREILTWMKSWDDIVFNKKFIVPKIAIPLIPNSLSPIKPKLKKKNEKIKDQFQYVEVDYIRQKHKIILIGGPPGVGKTTLANIIAKQCGYEPLIVNASEERTTDKLILRIYNSTLIHNLTNLKKDQKRKPSCLILDEIDGMSNNSRKPIKTIIDFIKTGHLDKKILEANKKEILDGGNNINDKSSNNLGGKANFARYNKNNKRKNNNYNNNIGYKDNDNTDDDDISNGIEDDDESNNAINENKILRRKQNANQGIQRPIICICNDLYAKQLSLLRKEALVYNLKKIDEKKLGDLLNSIAKKESLPIDKTTVKNIIELCNNDIRSCLLSLQFFSYHRKNKELISQIIHDKEKLKYFCNKDFNENLFNVWNKIFYRINSNINFAKELRYPEIKYLYDSCEEHKKIYEGLFNNYLKISTRCDNSLEDIQKRAELSDIFSYEDTMQGKGFYLMPGSFQDYIDLSGYYIHKYYFASNFEKGLIEYTSLFYDYSSKLRNYNSIIENIQENIYEKKHILYKKEELLINILPYIYQMVNPNIRELSYELLNDQEKKMVDTAINLLLYLGIDMKENTGNVDNKQNIYYEPDIKKLVTYDVILNEEENEDNDSLLNYNKQLILKAEFEKKKNLNKFNEEKDEKKDVKNELDTIKEKQEDYCRNFNMLLNTMGVGKKRKTNESKKYEAKFIYKFNEGITDCVRRPLDINYFYTN